jgi:hypothetical protein
MKKFKTLTDFTKAVNDLSRKDCEKINREGRLFGAFHHDFPERMLEDDWKNGLTPRQVITRITREAEAEWAAEARMS